MELDFHYFVISLAYHKVENLAGNGFDGSISGKVATLGLFQVKNVIKMINQLKWNSYPRS
jgi:hypothetical protein